MRRFVFVLSVVVSLVLVQPPSLRAATRIPIPEWCYVKIYNFSFVTSLYGPEVTYRGFGANQTRLYSLPAIEAYLVNVANPYSPPDRSYPERNGVLFDCHDGSAYIGEYAEAVPVVMFGQEPMLHAEFDWAAEISNDAAPYLAIGLWGGSWSGPLQAGWETKPGAGYHSGHVELDLRDAHMIDTLSVRLSVERVPEPSAILPLGSGLLWLAYGRLRRRKRP